MKAIIHEGPNKYTFTKNYPVPKVTSGDVLLKVKACGFCGTDFKIFKNGHRAVMPPRIIGHEIIGEIVKTGGKISGTKIGDRVIVVTPVGCTKCLFCRRGQTNMCPWVAKDVHSIGYYTDGGFAEYCLVPKEAVKQNVLIKVPKSVSDTEAVIVEPFSCVINGQEKLKITPEDSIVIIGAGPIGCLHGLLAKAQGIKNLIITDVSQEKLDMAKKVIPSAMYILNKGDLKEKILSATDESGANVIIVAAPAPQAQQVALQIAAVMGRISYFAGLPKGINDVSIETNLIHYRELEVYGSFASSRHQYIKALKLIKNKKINVKSLITHSLPLQDMKKAIELFESQKTMKTVIVND